MILTYESLIDAYTEDATHIRALISARGVKKSDVVDQDFIDVMREEGYVIPDIADFEV